MKHKASEPEDAWRVKMMNRRIVLNSRPTSVPVHDNFRVEDAALSELEEA